MTDPVVGLVLEGRYRLEERLARGGMSTVYAATDLRLHKTVAVKVMADHLAHDPTFVDRFTREARAAAMLSHPNVVGVSDQGSDQGLVFLVMELVRGRTLRDLLTARGRLTVAEAFAVLEPVLSGLTAAHRAGIVHRDIKPENVLIGVDGVVKVADFGLARAVVGTGQTSQTGGVLIGTVAYLSPEQLERGRADARSDIYAAGIVLYEMLTGHPPFGGDTPLAVAYQHVHHDVPPPSAEVPGLPRAVDELVARTTRRDPAGRPLDAGAFLAEMNQVRKGLGIEPVPVPTGRSTAGPGHAAPDQPADPAAAPQRPDDRGAGPPIDRHGRTGVLPGHGRRPDDERQRPPARGRARPTRRARRTSAGAGPGFAVAIILLLAVTIGAIGWWLGSGRWTQVPELDRQAAGRRDRPAAERRARPRLLRRSSGARSSPPGAVMSTDPKAGDGRSAAPTSGSSCPEGPGALPRRPGAGRQAVGATSSRSCRRPAGDPVHDHRGASTTTWPPARWSASTRPPAPTSSATRSSRSSSARATSRSPSPTSPGQTPEQAEANLEAARLRRQEGRRRPQRRRRRRRGHGGLPGAGRRAGRVRQHGDDHRSRPACRRSRCPT